MFDMNKSKYVSHYGNHQLATRLNSILFLYCSVTNYHKCSCLEQHTFIISVSAGPKLVHGLPRFSASVSLGTILESIQHTNKM